jgi:hypothetical protein
VYGPFLRSRVPYRKLPKQWITQPSKYRGVCMPPNMSIGEIGLVTGRIVMSKRMLVSRLSPPVSASLHHCTVETAYLLGVHCWEREMLQEAGGEFIALCVCVASIVLFDVFLSNSAWPSLRNVVGDGSRARRRDSNIRRSSGGC